MIICGDAAQELKKLPEKSTHCCVTSPPYYGLRDYGQEGQLGLEKTPEEFVDNLVSVFREVRRVLRDDGTLWLNLGDSYARMGSDSYATGKNAKVANQINERCKRMSKPPAGFKHKDLIGIPWRVAFALQSDGWYLRQDIIWHKPNPMPESVKDRCTKAHEYIFLLSKNQKYFYDAEAVKEPAKWERWGNQTEKKKHPGTGKFLGGKMLDELPIKTTKNKRSVWTIPTKPCKEAHFAVFPPTLIQPCILAGCPENGTVLDPFFGAGTTGIVAQQHNRKYIGIDISAEYCEIAKARIAAAELEVREDNK